MSNGKNAVVIQQSSHMLEVLHSKNYKVMQSNNCVDGLRNIIRYRPNLVIAEIDIPNLNGLSMARILNILNINIPVILTSYKDQYQNRIAAFDNIIGYVKNPENTGQDQVNAFRTEILAALNRLPGFEKKEAGFQYHFRQHEWANLLGISRRKKILVIDDNKSFRTILLRRLDSVDKYSLFSAQDGLEGLLKALLTRPDLILTDIVMPTLDGMAMSQILYILNKPFPIVFLSARDDEKTKTKARKATGILEYLSKNELRDPAAFMERLDQLLLEAENMKSKNRAIYQKGASEQLENMQESP